MRRLLLPSAALLGLLCAVGVIGGLLPALPTVPAAVTLLLALSIAAASTPSWRLFGPALVRVADAERVALTFDDGPDPDGTPALLDALDAAGMKATFFAVGERAQQHPDLLRDIAARGHQVGNHSMHHRWPAIMSAAGARRELQEAQRVLGELLPTPPTLYRPPIGLVSPFVFQAAEEAGLSLAAWSLRTLDGRQGDPAALLRRLEGVRGGDVALLHDGRGPHGRIPAAEAAAEIVALLQGKGLRSVTMDELFGPQPAARSYAVAVGHIVRVALLLLLASAFLAP